VLVVAQAAAALALMRLAPPCFCAEVQPQQLRQRGACVTPEAATEASLLLGAESGSAHVPAEASVAVPLVREGGSADCFAGFGLTLLQTPGR
jgi:hypothetical protein